MPTTQWDGINLLEFVAGAALSKHVTKNRFLIWPAGWTLHMYPPAEVVAEVGRVGVAAALVDKNLALTLVALHDPRPYEELLLMFNQALCRALVTRIKELFEGELAAEALELVAVVEARSRRRNAVIHTIWTADDGTGAIDVAAFLGARTDEDFFDVIRRHGDAATWTTLHPRTGTPGPQTMEELGEIRWGLEEVADALELLRLTLASALFAGRPYGAREGLRIDHVPSEG